MSAPTVSGTGSGHTIAPCHDLPFIGVGCARSACCPQALDALDSDRVGARHVSSTLRACPHPELGSRRQQRSGSPRGKVRPARPRDQALARRDPHQRRTPGQNSRPFDGRITSPRSDWPSWSCAPCVVGHWPKRLGSSTSLQLPSPLGSPVWTKKDQRHCELPPDQHVKLDLTRDSQQPCSNPRLNGTCGPAARHRTGGVLHVIRPFA